MSKCVEFGLGWNGVRSDDWGRVLGRKERGGCCGEMDKQTDRRADRVEKSERKEIERDKIEKKGKRRREREK